MNNDKALLDAVLRCGLVQFGVFEERGMVRHVRLGFDLLVSYPELLDALATRLHAAIEGVVFERILCSVPSLPLAVLLSQRTGVPLVYRQQRHASATLDFVGAYDIGHPTLLVEHVLDEKLDVVELKQQCASVGLELNAVASILSFLPTDTSIGLQPYTLWDWRSFLAGTRELGFMTMHYENYLRQHL